MFIFVPLKFRDKAYFQHDVKSIYQAFSQTNPSILK